MITNHLRYQLRYNGLTNTLNCTLFYPVGLSLVLLLARKVCAPTPNKFASGASPGSITTLQITENVVPYVLFISPAGARHQIENA